MSPKNRFHIDPYGGMQTTDFGPAIQQALAGRAGIVGQQQDLASQLQQQALGKGPSLAQPLLQAATEQNQNLAAGQLGSTKGINPGLAGQLIARQRAGIQQGSALQGALLRNQEQLGAQGALGGLLGTMGQQNLGALGIGGGLQQGQNQLGMQNYYGAQNINAGVAGQNAEIQGKITGGLLGGAGAALAHVGALPPVPASAGGDVPGHALAHGDSPANDRVPAMLSPHEIVLPRSVTLAEDAPERARDFVRAIKGRRGGYQKVIEAGRMAGGGEAPRYDDVLGKLDSITPFLGEMPQTAAQKRLMELDNSAIHAAEGGDVPPAEPSIEAFAAPPPSANPDTRLLGGLFPPPPGKQVVGGVLEDIPEAIPAAQGTPEMLARPSEQPIQQPFRPGPAAPKPPMLGVGEMQAGERQEIAGIKGQQTAAEEFAKTQTGLMDTWNKAREDMMAKFQLEAQAHQAKADAMFQSLLDPKNDVNPNRFWEQKSTGGKISASIGMILGGIGAGLTGGPNYAVELINKAIDRDIEAQKLNIGKKQNALSQYMQQGRDMQQAHLLATADMKDAAAAQLARAATAYQGTKAAADAQVQIGILRQDAYAKRAQVTALDFQNQMAQLNYSFMQRVMGHMGQQGSNFARSMQDLAILRDPKLAAETDISADRDVPTGAVDQATGQPLMQTVTEHFRGKSATATEKAHEALAHNRVMDTSLKELEAFQAENPLGGTPGSEAVGRARAAVQNIRLNYEATMAGMNRQASPEVIKHMEDIAKDPSVLFKTGKTAGALKFLRKMINEHKQNVLDTYTLGPQ